MEQPFVRPCPECGGQRVTVSTWPAILVYGVGHVFKMFPKKSDKSNKSSSVKTVSCLKCGRLFFYAEEPERLIPNE